MTSRRFDVCVSYRPRGSVSCLFYTCSVLCSTGRDAAKRGRRRALAKLGRWTVEILDVEAMPCGVPTGLGV